MGTNPDKETGAYATFTWKVPKGMIFFRGRIIYSQVKCADLCLNHCVPIVPLCTLHMLFPLTFLLVYEAECSELLRPYFWTYPWNAMIHKRESKQT